jgi:hypothetical protein
VGFRKASQLVTMTQRQLDDFAEAVANATAEKILAKRQHPASDKCENVVQCLLAFAHALNIYLDVFTVEFDYLLRSRVLVTRATSRGVVRPSRRRAGRVQDTPVVCWPGALIGGYQKCPSHPTPSPVPDDLAAARDRTLACVLCHRWRSAGLNNGKRNRTTYYVLRAQRF